MLVAQIGRDDLGDLLGDGGLVAQRRGAVSISAQAPLSKGHGILSEVSLVRRTANIATRPIMWSRHDIAKDGGGQPRGIPLHWRDTWDRAAERMGAYAYKRRTSLDIVDIDELPVVDELLTDPEETRRLVRAAPRPPAPKPIPESTSEPALGPVLRHSYAGAGLALT